MKKAEYQRKFSLEKEVIFKPNTQQKKLLVKVAENKGKTVSEYSEEALTKSLIEEDKLIL
jgi:hypothetical protein